MMAKGQKHSNREAKKPKGYHKKPAATPTSTAFDAPPTANKKPA